MVYVTAVVFAIACLAWSDLHTDQVTVILAFQMAAGAMLGYTFPDRRILSAA